jgi:hypothetical protein
MGGDDLGSDDEYLFDSGLIDASGGRGTAISSDDEGGSISDDDGLIPQKNSSLSTSSKKRKGTAEDDNEPTLTSSKKKRKKKNVPTNSKNILIHAGRGIAMDGVEAQAMFLGTIYSHSNKLAEGADEGGADDNDDEGEETKQSATSFSFEEHLYSHPTTANAKHDEKTNQFQHNNLSAFLKSGPLPSMKRLKNWKHAHSPMVLIVTLSARRSVELMKQLSAMKLPVAKLFAKHMSVEDQVELLKGVTGKKNTGGGGAAGGGGGSKKGTANGRCYSLAVGTPGRLLKLLRHGRDEPGSDGLGALRLNHTEVVIIDCHEDSKGWTVCTLKDTSKDMMELMKEGVVPQLEKRKGKIKLAMF